VLSSPGARMPNHLLVCLSGERERSDSPLRLVLPTQDCAKKLGTTCRHCTQLPTACHLNPFKRFARDTRAFVHSPFSRAKASELTPSERTPTLSTQRERFFERRRFSQQNYSQSFYLRHRGREIPRPEPKISVRSIM